MKIEQLVLLFLLTFSAFSQEHNLINILSEYTKKDTVRVQLLSDESIRLYSTDTKKAISYAQEAYQLSKELNFVKGQARSLNILGICYDEISELNKAFDYYQKSSEAYQSINDLSGLAKTYNNLGILFRIQGNYAVALEYYQKSLAVEEELNRQVGISKSLNNIGVIYWYQEDYSRSLEFFQKSLNIDKKLSDKSGIASSYNNVGMVYEKLGNHSKAIQFYREALGINKNNQDWKAIANSYQSIGFGYLLLKEFTKAKEYFDLGLNIARQHNLKLELSHIYRGLSSYNFQKKKYSSAFRLAMLSYDLSNELDFLVGVIKSAELVSESAGALGNYKAAYEYHKKLKILNDSIFNKNQIQKITRLQAEYEFQKQLDAKNQEAKNLEIKREIELKELASYTKFLLLVLLFTSLVLIFISWFYTRKKKLNIILKEQRKDILQKNIRLQEYSDELKKLNQTKDKLFKIIGHDLRNPFIEISQFAQVLQLTIDDMSKEKLVSLITSIGKSSDYSLNMLDNLLNWASSQNGQILLNLEHHNLGDLIKENIRLVSKRCSDKNIKIETRTIYENDVEIDENIINLLLRNLISNAIKFTNNGGKIIISNRIHKGTLVTSITDNGVGMSKEVLDNLFIAGMHHSDYGTEDEKGIGIGLLLCFDMIKKHGGEIWAESELGKGSTFSFSFPLDEPAKQTEEFAVPLQYSSSLIL